MNGPNNIGEPLGLKNALKAAESWMADGGHAESGSGRTIYLQIRSALASAPMLPTAPSDEAVWEAAKAVRPLLFSEDETVAHRAASPESMDSVRKRVLDDTRTQLGAAYRVDHRAREKSMDQIGAFGDTLDRCRDKWPNKDSFLSLAHHEDMFRTIVSDAEFPTPNGFDDAKLGRWLGWLQGVAAAFGLVTLDECKQINLRHVSGFGVQDFSLAASRSVSEMPVVINSAEKEAQELIQHVIDFFGSHRLVGAVSYKQIVGEVARIASTLTSFADHSCESRSKALKEALLQSAENQIAYWAKKQNAEKFPEEATDQDGECHLTWEEALCAGRCNGAYGHAHWWREHITAVFDAKNPFDAALPGKRDGGACITDQAGDR